LTFYPILPIYTTFILENLIRQIPSTIKVTEAPGPFQKVIYPD